MKQFGIYLLRWAAKRKLARIHPFIIAVTGSVGKSTCISLLDGVLSGVKKVKTTTRGNSESGLPLEILGIRNELSDYRFITWVRVLIHAVWIGVFGDSDTYEVLIAEMGIDSPYPPKNMSYLLTLISHPDVAIITSIAPVHTEQFSDGLSEHDKTNESVILSRIAKEKMLLARAVEKTGTVILAADSSYMMREASTIRANVITVGKSKSAIYTVQEVRPTLHNGSIIVFSHSSTAYTMNIPRMVVFQEEAITIVSVIAAAVSLGVPVKQSITTIEKISRLPPGRFSILEGVKETMIIDSSYNASPDAMKAALSFLKTLALKKGRKIVVIGDMRELGPIAEQKHAEIAQMLIDTADYVVCIGVMMRNFMVPELMRLGFDSDHLDVFETAEGVGRSLQALLRPGDVILVKGSQNTLFLETVVKDLLQKKTDMHLLCRQSAYWDDVRNSFFSSHPNILYAKSTYSK